MITSTANQKVKNIISLMKKPKLREEKGVFLVEGIKMVREALSLRVQEVYIVDSFYQELMSKEPSFLKEVPVEVVSEQVMKAMTDTVSPQGILALVSMPVYSFEEVVGSKESCLILLENIRDPGNLGTILRTAEGAGVNGVILSKECVDIYNPKVVRSTMGSIFRVPFLYTESLYQTITEIKKRGIRLYAAHLKATVNYEEMDYTKGCGFLIGNEANGLTEETAKMADDYVIIPMLGKVESLNAAMATSILAFEVARQRRLINK